MMSSVCFILVAVGLGIVGQLLVKMGINSLDGLSFSSGLVKTYLRIFLSPLVVVGTLSYFSSVFFWMYALAKVDLSFAYPFLALSYAIILVCSSLFLGETVPPLRWIGVAVICLGVFVVSRS